MLGDTNVTEVFTYGKFVGSGATFSGDVRGKYISLDGSNGVDGTFTVGEQTLVVVKNGIITLISEG
jgi:cytoskeletal protein CcmA (bactofilin family)